MNSDEVRRTCRIAELRGNLAGYLWSLQKFGTTAVDPQAFIDETATIIENALDELVKLYETKQ